MTDEIAPRTSTNGFLFADLRGYSDYVELRGDVLASGLLARYRDVVRSVVSQHEGAEIRTEGDSFFVVFPSASRAVTCGMEILAATTAAALPVGVGVGVHAGETASTSEGPVGSAVNIAARVCAMAAPGELLVTDTVRALTRTLLPYAFLPRGSRTLKGIVEPVALYRVVEPSDSSANVGRRIASGRAIRGRRSSGLILAGIGATVVVSVLVMANLGLPGTLPDGSPRETARPSPSEPGNLTLAERDLVSRVAWLTPEMRDACRPGAPDERASGAVASITCPLTLGVPASQVHYDLFDQPAVMLTAFDAYVAQHGSPTTDCRQSPLGHGAWSVERISLGHVLCYPDDGMSRIVWTYEGGSGAGVMGSAIREDDDWAELYEWWRQVHPLMAH